MKKHIPKIIGKSLNTLSYLSPRKASQFAINIFSKPRKGKLNERQNEFLNASKQNTISYENLKIATYQWQGKGKTILLVHGWESNTARWKKLIHKLQKKDFNITALDAPAHGNSTGKKFNAVLYAECINAVVRDYKPEIIIGHSVGAMASVFFQKKYQLKYLEKLVLLGSPADFNGVFSRYVDMMSYNKTIAKTMNKLIVEYFGHKPDYFSVVHFSKEIHIEGLIIHDKDDRVIPFSDAELIAKNYSNSTLIATTKLGHGLQNDFVNNEVINFIERY